MNHLPAITIERLIESAKLFCDQESNVDRAELYAITDGKAIGTFIEHLFQKFLSKRYSMEIGSSANGLDLPSLNTDIKVTSIKQPQSSCPFKDSRQKIFGLGYNLIIFVYDKTDDHDKKSGSLNFVSSIYVDSSRTADYQTTIGILEILDNSGNRDDIFAFLNDRHIPGDEITLLNLAEEIIQSPPSQGYLTISNALQWRLQYSRVVNLNQEIEGLVPIVKYAKK